jgi:hypothetical protein
MPSLAREGQGFESLREVFPELACFSIGWGEPFCFRCGWLSPSKEAADYPRHWPAGRAIDAAWEAASGWLERCHLQDHRFGGTADPLNLVPLCVLCHQEQPPCETRSEGLLFVNSVPPRRAMEPWAQLLTNDLAAGRERPGRAGTLQTISEAQELIAVWQARALESLISPAD